MASKRDRVRVAISGPDAGGGPAWFFSQALVRWKGGKPIRVTPSSDWSKVEFDALILGGGSDVDHTLYKKTVVDEPILDSLKKPQLSFIDVILSKVINLFRVFFSIPSSRGKTDKDRDKMEFELIRKALQTNAPILGICRGMQLLNVYFGGNLHGHISGYYQEAPQVRSVLPKKKIQIKNDSQLMKAVGSKSMYVNALHDQAVDELGQGLRAVAYETSGIIQSIELSKNQKVIGVQWHPEYMPQSRQQRKLFKWLTENASITGQEKVKTVQKIDDGG